MLPILDNIASIARKISIKHARNEFNIADNKQKKLAMGLFEKQCIIKNSHLEF